MYEGIDNDALFQIQWSSLEIIESEDLKLNPNTPDVHSLKDLDPTGVVTYGEFRYF